MQRAARLHEEILRRRIASSDNFIRFSEDRVQLKRITVGPNGCYILRRDVQYMGDMIHLGAGAVLSLRSAAGWIVYSFVAFT